MAAVRKTIVKPDETIEPTFKTVFECRTMKCIEKVFEALGIPVEELRRQWGVMPAADSTIVFTDVTDYLCEDDCSASLVDITERVYMYGDAKPVDARSEWRSCGPDTYRVICHKYKLTPGSMVYWRRCGYIDDRDETADIVYIYPKKKVSVTKTGELVIEE